MSLPPFLERRELPSRDPATIRRILLEDLMEVASAQAGLFFKAVLSESEAFLRAAAVERVGPPAFQKVFREVEGLPIAGSTSIEIQAEFGRLASYGLSHTSPIVRDFWDRASVHSALAMNVERQGVYVGNFGVFRSVDRPEFPPDAGAAFRSRSAAYADLLVAADLIETADPKQRSVFVIRDGRRIEYASRAARALLKREGFAEALLADARALSRRGGSERASWLEGASLRIHRVHGEGGLAQVAILEPVENAPMPEAARLTFVQRRVATLAAAGMTIPEMATELGRRPETVRSHLREIYERLGIASRAELAVLVESAWK